MCILNQGHEFVNEVNQKLFEKVGIEHRVSSAYHPQTNWIDERKSHKMWLVGHIWANIALAFCLMRVMVRRPYMMGITSCRGRHS